jgi:hypothetical protein
MVPDALTGAIREGARKIIEQAIDTGLALALAAFSAEKLAGGWARLVRHGSLPEREVLLDLKRRGLKQDPKLAIGAGALGFWMALREVFATTREQRC